MNGQYIEKYQDGKSFSYGIYGLKHQIEYLIHQKQVVSFTKVLHDLEAIIGNYESMKKW